MLKLFGAEPSESAAPSLAAECDGFNLHADVAFESHERVAVERLCRFMLRGRLKTPKPDGSPARF